MSVYTTKVDLVFRILLKIHWTIWWTYHYQYTNFKLKTRSDALAQLIQKILRLFLTSKISLVNLRLIESTNQSDKRTLFTNYMPIFIDELKKTSNVWNENSYDRLVFQTLVIESDLIVNNYLDQIIEILNENLQTTKDIETRTKFLILLSQIILKCDSLESNNFSKYAQDVCNQMIIPNLIWKAGRTATAVRMTATATLVTLFQTNFFRNIQVWRVHS